MKIYLKRYLNISISIIVLLSCTYYLNSKKIDNNKEYPSNKYNNSFNFITDTIFVCTNNYVTISLSKQVATLYQKDGDTLSFKVSSGDSTIYDGISTPTGVFTVKVKSPIAISKEYNNAKLFHWMEFNYFDGKIGMHSLEGTKYYQHLGKKPSSHGCVRMTREDAATLYDFVQVGTPVIVFNDRPDMAISFASKSQIDTLTDFNLVGHDSLEVYLENWLIRNNEIKNRNPQIRKKIFLNGNNIFAPSGYSFKDIRLILEFRSLSDSSKLNFFENLRHQDGN